MSNTLFFFMMSNSLLPDLITAKGLVEFCFIIFSILCIIDILQPYCLFDSALKYIQISWATPSFRSWVYTWLLYFLFSRYSIPSLIFNTNMIKILKSSYHENVHQNESNKISVDYGLHYRQRRICQIRSNSYSDYGNY